MGAKGEGKKIRESSVLVCWIDTSGFGPRCDWEVCKRL